MIIETENQFHRTLQALAETGTMIAREERHSPRLQDPHFLAFLKRHADKLITMLDEYKAR